MKIRIMSDLHREFADFDYQYAGEDVLVAAGDIDKGVRGISWLNKLALPDHVAVCTVAGNHEYYGTFLPDNDTEMKSTAERHVHVLDNSDVCIGGVRFLGATLWTDMAGMGDVMQTIPWVQHEMNDYKEIQKKPECRKLKPEDTIALHKISVAWLKERMIQLQGEPVVVVTHHVPSIKSIAKKYQDNILSAAFFSNLDPLIRECKPLLWIHGHTHSFSDYHIGETRVVCNPRGYPGEHTGFDHLKIIEIDT